MDFRSLLLVCAGGALGSGARYLVGVGLAAALPGVPAGTLAVNLVGSLLMGLLLQLGASAVLPPLAVLTLTTGVMGGFTTYSSFNQETLRLLLGGAPGWAALYIAITVVGGLLAGAAGMSLGRIIVSATP